MSLFIHQPQHHPSTPPFALHPVPSTITLNASASVNTCRLAGIKKIPGQGEEKKEWRRERSKKRSGAEKRLGSGEVQLFQSWLGSWQKAKEGRQCNAVQIQGSIDAHWSIGLLGRRVREGGRSVCVCMGGLSALFFQSQAQRR